MPNMICAMCGKLSCKDKGAVTQHYFAKFEPLMMHHECWELAQRLEMKLKPIRR